MATVYLAGPISGLTYDASESWRHQFKELVAPTINCFSPLRNKQFLQSRGVLEQSYGTVSPLSSDRGIMTRDHNDCMTSDAIVCNLSGVSRVSIGTVMEIAWSFAYRKPLILILDNDNCHDHPMIREATGYRVDTIHEAAHLALAILTPGV